MFIPLYTLIVQMNSGEIISIYPLVGLGVLFLIFLLNITLSRYMMILAVFVTFIYRILDIIFPHYGCFTQHYFSLAGGFRDYGFIAFDGTFMWGLYLLALPSLVLISAVHLYILFVFYSKEGLSLYGLRVQINKRNYYIFGYSTVNKYLDIYPVVKQIFFSNRDYIPPLIWSF